MNTTLSLIIGILITVLIYILKNPEKLDKWSYLLNKYKFYKSEKTEKKIISKNIDYKITRIAKKINKEADGILPFGIRIKWCDKNEVESYVKKNEVIVVLKKEDNNDKNIVDTCRAYVPKALLPKSRNAVDPDTLKSIDNYIIKSILSIGAYDSAYNYFIDNTLNDLLKSEPKIKSNFDTIDKLNNAGFFTRILLEEYRRLGARLYGKNDEQAFQKESIKFFDFLNNLVNRNPGDNSQLSYNGDKIKIAIVFVAKRETYVRGGIDAYIKRIDKNIDNGVQRLFLLSYAQEYYEVINNNNGETVDRKKKKDFVKIDQLEKICSKREDIRLLKKQKYQARDVKGRKRSSKYLLYEIIR